MIIKVYVMTVLVITPSFPHLGVADNTHELSSAIAMKWSESEAEINKWFWSICEKKKHTKKTQCHSC